MSRTSTPWILPDRTIDTAERADREIRISDFGLAATLPLCTVSVAGRVPLNEVAMAVLVALCLFRRARGGAQIPFAARALVAALLGLLLYSGLVSEHDWTRRMGHLVIMAGLLWAGGTGRLSRRSIGAGLATGLLVVIALAIVDIPPGAYGDRLTGFLGDPNAGAYFISVLGLLAIFFADDRWPVRVAIAAPLVVGLVLCLSRTGLLAGGLALLWLLVGRRMTALGGVAVAVVLVWLVDNIPASLATFGPFSDRSGSDKLRERIIAQEHVQLADMAWHGTGPGTATVKVRGLEFFFHNSYLATRQEGGWIALFLILALMVFAFLRLSDQSRAGDMRAAAAQAAIVAGAAMAITLGEVLLETPMFLALALALGQAIPETTEIPETPEIPDDSRAAAEQPDD